RATLDGSGTNVLLDVSPPLIEQAVYTLSAHGLSDHAAAGNTMALVSMSFTALAPVVRITEFVAKNTVGLLDADSEHSDWIELQNQNPFALDLAGWRLTDNPATPLRWVFPAAELAPGAFLIVFASGKDRRVPGTELHTNFRLDGAS